MMMMMMILLHIKTSNRTLLRERSCTAISAKQTGREIVPRLKHNCLNSVLSCGLHTSRVSPRGTRNQAMSSPYSSLRWYSGSDLVFTRCTSRLPRRYRSVQVPGWREKSCFNCTNCVLYLHLYRSHTTNQTKSSRRRTNRQGKLHGKPMAARTFDPLSLGSKNCQNKRVHLRSQERGSADASCCSSVDQMELSIVSGPNATK